VCCGEVDVRASCGDSPGSSDRQQSKAPPRLVSSAPVPALLSRQRSVEAGLFERNCDVLEKIDEHFNTSGEISS